MFANAASSVLVLGIGNSLRADDGIGQYVCAGLEKAKLPGVQTRVVSQLQVEMLPELGRWDSLIIVDAATDVKTVTIRPLDKSNEAQLPASHHLSADTLAALGGQLGFRLPQIQLCAVPAFSFDWGEKLSEQGRRAADEAISQLCTWLSSR